jgi:hypothetical protein
MGWTYDIFSIVRYEGLHFGLSLAAGWLAYSSISTILSRTGLRDAFPRWPMPLLVSLAALSFAVLAHVLEDFTLGWF